jgi:hypothetical protein
MKFKKWPTNYFEFDHKLMKTWEMMAIKSVITLAQDELLLCSDHVAGWL